MSTLKGDLAPASQADGTRARSFAGGQITSITFTRPGWVLRVWSKSNPFAWDEYPYLTVEAANDFIVTLNTHYLSYSLRPGNITLEVDHS